MGKPQNQPSLASLTVAEREQLADWLRHGHYNDVLERATKPRPEGLGLTFTSDKPLRTFYAKVALFDVINAQLAPDKKLSLATFESLGQRHIHLFLAASGDEEKLAAAHQAILNTTVELAGTATTATQLLALQRLADFPERAALRAAKEERAQAKAERDQKMHDHKIALDLRKEAHKIEMDHHHKNISERNTTIREAHLKLAEQKLADQAPNSKLKTKNSKLAERSDALGPIATNWKEVGQRVCKLFNISPEEEARRAELHKTWVDPNVRPGIPEEINPVIDSWDIDPASESTDSPVSCEGAVASEELRDLITPSTMTSQNTDLLITDHSPSAPSVPSSSEPSSENQLAAPSAPIGPIGPIGPISEPNNPPAPPAPSNNPAPAPLTRDQRLAEFYKGMAAHARELHNQLIARRAQLEQEAQNENHEPQNTEH